jgi:hypothetical protein
MVAMNSRSEMHNPAVTIQYSLILECYLRHNQEHMQELFRQSQALNKLTFVNQLVKMDRYKFEDAVGNSFYIKPFCFYISPLIRSKNRSGRGFK